MRRSCLSAPCSWLELDGPGLGSIPSSHRSRSHCTACKGGSLGLLARMPFTRSLAVSQAWQAEFQRHNRPNALPWRPLSAAEFQQQAKRCHHKAAGADGWTGEEVRHWPTAIWQLYATLWQRWLEAQAFPRLWQCYLQVHSPKDKPDPGLGLEVSLLRPLVLEPILCRIASSAWAKRSDTRQWQQQWAPPGAHGGFERRGVHTAVYRLHKAYEKCYGLLSLDYSKCFDYVHPTCATHALAQLGMPQPMVDLCRFQWGHQQRYLSLQNCYDAVPAVVQSSLPQGDALSPMGLNALMWAPVQAFRQAEPSAELCVYLDDRNVVVKDHDQLHRTLAFWHRWTSQLGLRENCAKQRFLARSKLASEEVTASGILPVVATLRVLGVDFRTRINGKDRPTHQQRRQVAEARAKRIALLPLTFAHKCALLRQHVVPVAVWGTWLVHRAHGTWSKLQSHLARTLCAYSSQPSNDLVAILQGHSLDLQFMAHSQTVSMWARLFQQGYATIAARAIQGTWQYAAWQHLKDLGWQLRPQGHWTHSDLPRERISWHMPLPRLKHMMRAAWRRQRFQAWKQSARRDASVCAQVQYSEARVRQAYRLWNSTCGHGRAVMTGSIVSPARMQVSRMGEALAFCPFCRSPAVADWKHCAWECVTFQASRPRRPVDAMQLTLGWPCAGASPQQNVLVLDHLASVRKQLVQYRCA